MEVIVLGSGTSTGVPVVRMPAGLCDLDDARNWRTRSSVHVISDRFHLQIDAAPEFRIQCLENGVTDVHAFILTHGHADHVLGMDDLRCFCDLNGSTALPVYSTPAGLTRVRQIFPYAILDRPSVRGYPAFRLTELPPAIEIGPFQIRSTLLPHGAVETLGLDITESATGKRFTYYTDCADLPPDAIALARQTDILILDGLRPDPHPSHLHIPRAIELAQEIAAHRTWLTHLTAQVDHAPVEASLPAGIYLAYDGLRITP